MTAVVTGAAGFIGSVLVRTLLQSGEHVVAVDREPVRATVPGLTVLTADLLDRDVRVCAALESADAVFHLAGCPGVRDRGRDVRRRRHRDNTRAAAAVLAAVPPRTPLVVTSSSSVYGGASSGRPCAETDALSPRGGYARSKHAVERLCQARLRSHGTVAIVRPFTVAGEGQRPDMALAQWIAAARAGQPLRILGSPGRTRDVTDVRDLARALCCLATREVAGVVNVGTGVGRTLREMTLAVADVVGAEVTTCIRPASRHEAGDTLADTRLLKRLAGFVPHTDLREVVARQVAARYGAAPEEAPGQGQGPTHGQAQGPTQGPTQGSGALVAAS
ncbi:MAG: NAD-dependent epimerase/dehydratase family protein [Carbonactinosporaceae bacterium]